MCTWRWAIALYETSVKPAIDFIDTGVFTEPLHPATPLCVNLLVALFHVFLSVILFKKPGVYQDFKSLYTYLFSIFQGQ